MDVVADVDGGKVRRAVKVDVDEEHRARLIGAQVFALQPDAAVGSSVATRRPALPGPVMVENLAALSVCADGPD